MGNCLFCNEPIPNGLDYCPNCYTKTQPPIQVDQEPISPFLANIQKGGKEAKGDSKPGSRQILLGCLTIMILVGIGLFLSAPWTSDRIQALIIREPTASLYPSPRPTLTPLPIPIPTPRWSTHFGMDAMYTIQFPPHWVVIDMKHAQWEAAIRRESLDYPWLESQFTVERRNEAAGNGALVAFDPQRKGRTMIQCWTCPELAGMTITEIRNELGKEIIKRVSAEGGRVQGGVRTEILTLGEKQVVSFEVVKLPDEKSTLSQPIKYWLLSTADNSQGYWIEISGIEQELNQDVALIRAIFKTFQLAMYE